MRFTEHELTVAVAGATKAVLAAQQREVRKGKVDVDQYWNEMDKYQRYRMLEPIGSQILPVLVALPDVEVEPGTRPTFTDEQIQAAVEECAEPDLGRMRRKVVLSARVALVNAALAAIPPRQDPDALFFADDL